MSYSLLTATAEVAASPFSRTAAAALSFKPGSGVSSETELTALLLRVDNGELVAFGDAARRKFSDVPRAAAAGSVDGLPAGAVALFQDFVGLCAPHPSRSRDVGSIIVAPAGIAAAAVGMIAAPPSGAGSARIALLLRRCMEVIGNDAWRFLASRGIARTPANEVRKRCCARLSQMRQQSHAPPTCSQARVDWVIIVPGSFDDEAKAAWRAAAHAAKLVDVALSPRLTLALEPECELLACLGELMATAAASTVGTASAGGTAAAAGELAGKRLLVVNAGGACAAVATYLRKAMHILAIRTPVPPCSRHHGCDRVPRHERGAAGGEGGGIRILGATWHGAR